MTREGRMWIGVSFVFVGLLLVACMLIGIGTGKEDEQPTEVGQKLMLAGFIILLLLFVVTCMGCVICSNSGNNNNDGMLGTV